MLLLLFVSIGLIHHADGFNMNPMFGAQDPRYSPQQLRNISLMYGDMVLTERQKKAFTIDGKVKFAAPVTDIPLWKDAVIPYAIDCSIENMPWAVAAVHAAMNQWMRKTCIRFVKHTTEKYYLTFFRNTHCWGNVGQVDSSYISVGPGCEYEHVMAHEIGHVVGYYHEQNRKDRDQWVRIHWENIGQFKSAFDIIKNTDNTIVNYDYASIMHYPWTAFSSNGKITMEPIRPLYGKRPYIEISKDDVYVTRKIYKCDAIERKRENTRKRFRIPKIFTEEEEVTTTPPHCPSDNNPFLIANPFYIPYFLTECVDLYKWCPQWAKAGYCSTKESVRLGCRLSCGDPVCEGSKCLDKDESCKTLAKAGECSTNTTVAVMCQKSCNLLCADHPPTRPPTEAPTTEAPVTKGPSPGEWPNRNFLGIGKLCKDRHANCRSFAQRGMCRTNKQWMLENCQISCPNARCDRQPKRPPGSCNTPLGLGVDVNGYSRIPDSAFSSATQLEPGAGWHAAPRNARLYFEDDYTAKRVGGWCSGVRNPDYIQVDLQQVHTISYIATQGRNMYYERISKFKINYSTDGQTYHSYQENGKDKEFYGNCDHFTPVLNRFKNTLRARFIRYVPLEFNWPCLRMEFFGC